MKRSAVFLLLSAMACTKSSPGPQAVTNPAQYALPTMGSGGYAFAFGSAWPGAEVPNGMMRVGPDTSGPYGTIEFLHFSGYWAGDDTIVAFTHLHLHGTGAQDYGVLGILPVPSYDATKFRMASYQSTFAKSSEVATPGYYGVTLDNGPIKAEFTATTHASHERFTYPAGAKSGTVIIDLDRHLTGSVPMSNLTLAPGQNTLSGDLQTSGGMSGGFHLYFTMRFNKAWTAQRVWDGNDQPSTTTMSMSGNGIGAALDFDVSDGKPVEVQVAVSLVSAAGAAANLAAELPAWSFDGTHTAAVTAWNGRLGALKAYGGTPDELQVFYSALHHAFVMPGVYSDVDGSFAYSGQTQMASGFHFVTDLSGWDIYRTLHSLYTLIAPDLALDNVQSLYAMAKIGGNFPKWPLATGDSGSMIGSAPDVMISETYVKGITGFDAMGAYKRLRDAALEANLPDGEGRGGRNDFPDYSMYSYVPSDNSQGQGGVVSLTCELNQDDFALGNFATALGQTSDAQALQQRSAGWQKLYDPATGFLRAHTIAGQIPDDGFDAGNFGLSAEYVEADAYQTEFCAQYDVDGLAKVWGGKDKLVAALSQLFQNSQQERAAAQQQADMANAADDPNAFALNLPPKYYFGGNEPDIHYAYLFARAGRPDLTQQWVPWIRSTFFTAKPNGLPGNDDGGTMAAWYVFSALGIYPVPGSDQYVVGTPEFPQVDIQVADGVFSVIANGVSATNIYVQDAKLNGSPLTTPIIHQADLKAGGSLVLTMGPNPSTWGQGG